MADSTQISLFHEDLPHMMSILVFMYQLPPNSKEIQDIPLHITFIQHPCFLHLYLIVQ
jgi:hypothetical protein